MKKTNLKSKSRIIKKKNGKRAKLLFTDTDSFCYEFETENFFTDISPNVKEKFDTTNFPKDHPSIWN